MQVAVILNCSAWHYRPCNIEVSI